MNRGQSLIELLVAIGIFVIVVSVLIFLILNSYVTGRLASEITIANFFAEEGLEAARSIRDRNFAGLTNGNHGLIISGGNWQFSGQSGVIDGKFTRAIKVDEIDPNRKKITSQVTWQFTEARPQEITLVTYLTNWQIGLEIRKPTVFTDIAKATTDPTNAFDYPDGVTFATTDYGAISDPSITFHTWETPTQTYNSLVLKYRYHVDSATDDTYAVAYSTDSGLNWVDLISPTSVGARDTTILVDLSPSQDLSFLQVKIYTTKMKKPDKRNLYTRDIWTEGNF